MLRIVVLQLLGLQTSQQLYAQLSNRTEIKINKVTGIATQKFRLETANKRESQLTQEKNSNFTMNTAGSVQFKADYHAKRIEFLRVRPREYNISRPLEDITVC